MKGMRLNVEKTKRSGMQIYFTMTELNLILEATDMLEADYSCNHPESESLTNINNKIYKAISRRMVMNRPLKKISDS